jgi:CheY-like chemotaxis protein
MTVDAPVILVAEDDAQHRLLIRAALAAAKLANPVRLVSDGDAAIAYLAGDGDYADRHRHPLPVLVLLDVHMPGASGLEVLAWMRAEPGSLGQIPTVMLTASDEEADIDAAFATGATSYLVKPVGFDALLDVVRGLGLRWVLLGEKPGEGAGPA